MYTFEDKLKEYADLLVRVGMNVQKGQDMVITAQVDQAPFARLSGGTNESMQFTGRVWCDNADYWTVYFDLTQGITEALGAAGVQAPAFRVINDK